MLDLLTATSRRPAFRPALSVLLATGVCASATPAHEIGRAHV